MAGADTGNVRVGDTAVSVRFGFADESQAGDGTRTRDPLFTRQALYQLSYSGEMPESRGK